jgi:hypothetical protein
LFEIIAHYTAARDDNQLGTDMDVKRPKQSLEESKQKAHGWEKNSKKLGEDFSLLG